MHTSAAAQADVGNALNTFGFHTRSIVQIGGWRAGRATYRIALADGRVIKARRHQGRLRGERAAEFTRALNDSGFPAPLAVVGRVTLEWWVEGTPLTDRRMNRAIVDAAARLLRRLHAVESLSGRRIRQRRSVSPLIDRNDRLLDELRSADEIDARARRRLGDVVRRGLPRGAVRGLTHNDFCAENLIETPAGLVCIDNEAVTLGFLDEDLARTWCRWAMPAWAWSRFRDMAASGGDPVPASTELAWRTVAAVRDAHRWHRARGTSSDGPRRALGRVLDEIG